MNRKFKVIQGREAYEAAFDEAVDRLSESGTMMGEAFMNLASLMLADHTKPREATEKFLSNMVHTMFEALGKDMINSLETVKKDAEFIDSFDLSGLAEAFDRGRRR